MSKEWSRKLLKNIYAIIFISLIWQTLSVFLGESLVPSPVDTLKKFLILMQGDFYLHILYSLYRIGMAILVSLLIGVPLGIAIGINKRLNEVISPIVYLLYPIPKIAFLPIFMILFGIGDFSKILLMIAIIVFQILIATRDAIGEIDSTIVMASKIMGFNTFEYCKEVVLPSISPKIFSSLRISVGIAISALFFSENYATKYGIGYFIMNSWSMVDYKEMFAGVLALSLMALLLYKLIDFTEKKLCPWRKI